MPDFNKGDFTQQGVAGQVNANLRLNEKRLVNIDLTSNEEAEGCTITGTVKDLLNNQVYGIGSGDGADLIDERRKLTYNRYHLFQKPVALNSWLDNVVIYESNDKVNYRYFIDVEALKNSGGNTVYVDKSSAGSDSGTQSDPYKTIKKAFQNTSNGDTILVAKGIYYKGELPPTTLYNKNNVNII